MRAALSGFDYARIAAISGHSRKWQLARVEAPCIGHGSGRIDDMYLVAFLGTRGPVGAAYHGAAAFRPRLSSQMELLFRVLQSPRASLPRPKCHRQLFRYLRSVA